MHLEELATAKEKLINTTVQPLNELAERVVSKEIDAYLQHIGFRKGASVAGSSGGWESFGTFYRHWSGPEIVLNYMTMPMLAVLADAEKPHDEVVHQFEALRRLTK